MVERGGWAAALGFSRAPRQADLIRNARHDYAQSSHGRLALLTHDRVQQGHPITVTHGGSILLAVPFQTVLVVLPIALIVAMPDGLVHEDRRLVMAFLLYVLALLFTFRIYHLFAARLVGAAATMRRFLITVTGCPTSLHLRPLAGRLASTIVLAWFGSDVDLTMNLEQAVFGTLLGDAVVPDSSFLDLMTALAVIPLSVHATLASLEGGGLTVPRWLRPSEESKSVPSSRLLNDVTIGFRPLLKPFSLAFRSRSKQGLRWLHVTRWSRLRATLSRRTTFPVSPSVASVEGWTGHGDLHMPLLCRSTVTSMSHRRAFLLVGLLLLNSLALVVTAQGAQGRGGSKDDFLVNTISVGNVSSPTSMWIQPDGATMPYVFMDESVEISIEVRRLGNAQLGKSAPVTSKLCTRLVT